MASEEIVSLINDNIEALSSLRDKNLISRGKWGELNFEINKNDFDQIFHLLEQVRQYPIKLLPDAVAQQFRQQIDTFRQVCEQIDAFQISTPNAQQTRNSLSSQVHSLADQITGLMAQWLPFLAMEAGQSDFNSQILEKAREDQKAIKSILESLKTALPKGTEAAAKAGVDIYSSAFENEEKKLLKEARTWLITTSLLALITALIAAIFWNADYIYSAIFDLQPDQEQTSVVLRTLGNKAFILLVFGSATLWCGKIYKSLRHQAAVYKQKAISIDTFETFYSAASDPQAKDAVLLETTKAIFSEHRTGYLDGQAKESPDVYSQITKVLQKDS
ncbi:MAG: hypothetical protein D6694_15745 [Gammaproteobacteria bacterium]|nr:MAG: hypothetical protein D6694_15745 [Gammaproteobacteria bacterium]